MAVRASEVAPRTRKSRKTANNSKRDQLVVDHLPLVKFLAQRMAAKLPPSVEVNDLISAGVIGLMDAVEKFQPERGVKFKTYAEQRVRGAMIDSLRSLDWAPRSLRKKERAVESAYYRLEQSLGRAVSDEEVAKELGLEMEEFYRWLNDLNGVSLGAVTSIGNEESDGETTDLLEYIPDAPEQNPYFMFEKSELRDSLTTSIENLPEKERLVISLYYYEELTMREIGDVLGVNESRVSQLHTKAIMRMRGRLRWQWRERPAAKVIKFKSK